MSTMAAKKTAKKKTKDSPSRIAARTQAARWARGRPAVRVSLSIATLELIDRWADKYGGRGNVIEAAMREFSGPPAAGPTEEK